MGKGPETFTERFNRLTSGLSDSKLASIMGMSPYGVRKLRQGDTQSLKLETALRLCRELKISPWVLVGDGTRQETPPPGIEERLRLLHGDLSGVQEELSDLKEQVAGLLERDDAEKPPQRGGERRRSKADRRKSG